MLVVTSDSGPARHYSGCMAS